MKKTFYFATVLLLMLGSCKKNDDISLFEIRPEERMNKSLQELQTNLSAAENGWIATLPTYIGGGYGFYMSFSADNIVKMCADLTDATAETIQESSYRVRADMAPTLVFDTYNYITILQDPTPEVFGGTRAVGFSSDVEFYYVRSTTDSIFLKGKKYGQSLILNKANAAQKALYETQQYSTAIHNFNAIFNQQNRYIDVLKNNIPLKVMIEINATNDRVIGKRLKFTGVLAGGKAVESSEAKFAYTVDGAVILNGGIVWQGITFVRFAWLSTTTLAVYDTDGNEYILNASVQPPIPLYLLLGNKYKSMFADHNAYYPGTDPAGRNILATFYDRVGIKELTSNYTFVRGNLTFVWDAANKRLTLEARVSQSLTSTTFFTTRIVYSYSGDEDNEYTFTRFSGPTGGYVANIMIGAGSIDDTLLSNKFKFDYHEVSGIVYAKMTSIDNPSIVFTFILR